MKKFTQAVVRVVQKVLVTVLLFFTYTVGMGVLFVLASVFRRGLLRDAVAADSNTFWLPSQGCEPDEAESFRQS